MNVHCPKYNNLYTLVSAYHNDDKLCHLQWYFRKWFFRKSFFTIFPKTAYIKYKIESPFHKYNTYKITLLVLKNTVFFNLLHCSLCKNLDTQGIDPIKS